MGLTNGSTQTERLADLIMRHNSIVFFGGAGTSCESGIPDFRSADGLWNEKLGVKLSPEQLVSHTYFLRYTEEFFDFYKSRLVYPDARPNPAHRALAALEKMGKLRAVITQNIDGLHQMAGSKNVYELHGSVHRNHCMKCGRFYELSAVTKSSGIPVCPECGGVIKPDVVLYEESLDEEVLQKSVEALGEADLLIVGGTSLVVYPAAGLLRYYRGREMVLINESATGADDRATLVIRRKIGEVFHEVMNLIPGGVGFPSA